MINVGLIIDLLHINGRICLSILRLHRHISQLKMRLRDYEPNTQNLLRIKRRSLLAGYEHGRCINILYCYENSRVFLVAFL